MSAIKMPYTREELERLIPLPSSARRTYPSPPDYQAALRDYLHMASGRAVSNPEPMAVEWRRNGDNIDAVRAMSGLTSADFGGIMQNGLTDVLHQSFDDGMTGIRAVTRDYQVENFRPVNFVEFGLGAPVELPEGLPAPKLPSGFTETTSDGALIKSYGGKVGFSYPIWSTFGSEISSALENYAVNFAGLEHSLVAGLLAAASLPEVSGKLTVTGLTNAAGALRTQTNASGQKTNWALETILVAPEDEVTARVLAFNCGGWPSLTVNFADNETSFNCGWPRIEVNPELEAGTYYAFVSPAHSPLLRVRLRGAGRPTLYAKPTGRYESAQFAITHDIGFTLLNGPGLVRVTES